MNQSVMFLNVSIIYKITEKERNKMIRIKKIFKLRVLSICIYN